ncbi:hypothetical protein ACFVYF_09735 [Streptomyces sp. NPDC058274]|uniref:hypothetical protein n=1 Tax=Streptomyces sp. NPDC058274 TaxID=3346416 RepID=UPI0036EB4262
MSPLSRRLFLGATSAAFLAAGAVPAAAVTDSIRRGTRSWTFENDSLRATVTYAGGTVRLTGLFNKRAGRGYLSAPSLLFAHELDGSETVRADDGGWSLGAVSTELVTVLTKERSWRVGERVRIPLHRTTPRPFTVTLVFEIYDGDAGLRYFTLVRNDDRARELTLTRSTVIDLRLPDLPHTLHYVPNMKWFSTRGSLGTGPVGTSWPKKALTVYDTGDGWSLSPELNWKTQRGNGNYPADYMLPPFAGINAWSGQDTVSVDTHPESLRLTLFPGEEFEYLAVNLTVFKGDVVDGKMADELHFRKRFKYHHTTALFHQNDWDYRGGPGRELPAGYYYDTVIPQTKRAGLDMVMLDDYWNTTRDSIEPSDSMKKAITGLDILARTLKDNGLGFGLWFSLTGDGHLKGRDLADPTQLAYKRGQIETLLNDYGVTQHMIDLTEYWQNERTTASSHAGDNVYRKALRTRNMLNDLVTKNPQYLPKLTSELDIAPTQGDRNNGLLHIAYNGWNTSNGGITGEDLSLRTALTAFGHLPMAATYMNGGRMTGRMEDYYSYMAVRAVKFPQDPGDPAKWPEAAVQLMGVFNAWRRRPEITALTDGPFLPVHLGQGWDTTAWDSSKGPYVWMWADTARRTALLVATAAGTPGTTVDAKVRWLKDRTSYAVTDITIDDDGTQAHSPRGTFTGERLRTRGLPVDLSENTSKGKAFWLSAR